jgi:putative endonuclease
MWHVYILLCKDSSFYTGICENINDRLKRHNSGRASKYTRSRRPVVLLYIEKCASKSRALRREAEIKDFSRESKKRLIKCGSGRRFPSALKIK